MTSAKILHLTKHHGLGNDFLIALEAANPGLVGDGEVARTLCERHRGIGADGMIYALGVQGDEADVSMELFNADGSAAEISGNGIRCLAQAVLRHEGRRDGDVAVATPAGVRRLSVEATDDPDVEMVRVEMGTVREGGPLSVASNEYPVVRRGGFDIGNPHLVVQVDSFDGIDPAVDGALLESDYAAGMNVHFMVVEPGSEAIALLHWERGAGVTEACGSGASVAAFAAHRWGLVGPTVPVDMPGGRAIVEICGDSATLIGPAAHVATIQVER